MRSLWEKLWLEEKKNNICNILPLKVQSESLYSKYRRIDTFLSEFFNIFLLLFIIFFRNLMTFCSCVFHYLSTAPRLGSFGVQLFVLYIMKPSVHIGIHEIFWCGSMISWAFELVHWFICIQDAVVLSYQWYL